MTLYNVMTLYEIESKFRFDSFFFVAAAAIASGPVGAKAPSADCRTQRIALRKLVVRCRAARAPVARGYSGLPEFPTLSETLTASKCAHTAAAADRGLSLVGKRAQKVSSDSYGPFWR